MNTKKIAMAGVVAAMYIVVSMMMGSVSFGIINVRLAVGLTMVAFFGVEFMLGVFIAHVITNMLGGLGMVDIVIGPVVGLAMMYAATIVDKLINEKKNIITRWAIMTIAFIPTSMAIGWYLGVMFGIPIHNMVLMVIAGNAIAQTVVGLPVLGIMSRLAK